MKRLFCRYNYPEKYMITEHNRFETQKNLECSGYSGAYIMRFYGEDVNGLDVYNAIDGKNADGTVNPSKLKAYLKSKGYKVKIKICGSVSDIKLEVSKGHPVITLAMVSDTNSYYHYTCVVGYDKDNLYIADSWAENMNATDEHYNRKISIKVFEKIWPYKVGIKLRFIIIVNKK